MNFNLYERTIFLVMSGSHAYGMATPTSDYDYRGIAIAPTSSYIGLLDKFEQCVDSDKGKHVYTHYPVGMLQDDPRVEGSREGMAPDMQIMELSKFVRLAMDNNPSILEILFTDPKHYVICNPIMETILEKRDSIISKQAKARFCGYALQQLNRIKRHRRWLEDPPDHQPTRVEFGLPETGLLSPDQIGAADALIVKEIDELMLRQDDLDENLKIEISNGIHKIINAVWRALHNTEIPIGHDKMFESIQDATFWGLAMEKGFTDNFLAVLAAEKRYRAAKREWDQYQNWLATRNPARAELEAKHKYDTKHGSHLVRLLRMAREIIETGKVNVLRPDAEELLAIRNGAMTYEQLVEMAEREDLALDVSLKKSKLRSKPDVHLFDDLVRKMIVQFNEALV
jgi:hypothetical protein